MKNKLLLLITISIILGLASNAHAALITNGSFESGSTLPRLNYFRTIGTNSTTISGWTVTAGNIDWIGTGLWEASDGNYSLDMTGTSMGTISQSFATQTGQQYNVFFDLAGNPGANGIVSLGVGIENGPWQSFSFDTSSQTVSDMGWVTHSWTFTAQAETTTLSFWNISGATNAGAALDNVSVTAAVPIPGAFFLLAAGLAGFVWFRRKNE